MPRAARYPAALAAAAALVLVAGGCGSSGSSSTDAASTVTVATVPGATGTTVDVTVIDARPQGGIKRVTVAKGEKVTLVVHSDTADEIHLHGYNLMKDVEAGGTVRIPFVASVPGRFEAELEQHGVQIADITVNP